MNEVQRWIEGNKPEVLREKQYEEACRSVPLGHLSANDVCMLFHSGDTAEWADTPGSTAKALVESRGLPLMQVAPGKWVVAFTVVGAS
ncbi:hypothetical protein [Nocardioides immobilis]|uniref:hypothetical protein n=1 Tax=Nocardioides immobilis TaxID=2049295 RepID=UPI0011C42411|nr:hypothetical protein [Nocardioides immobilis]